MRLRWGFSRYRSFSVKEKHRLQNLGAFLRRVREKNVNDGDEKKKCPTDYSKSKDGVNFRVMIVVAVMLLATVIPGRAVVGRWGGTQRSLCSWRCSLS